MRRLATVLIITLIVGDAIAHKVAPIDVKEPICIMELYRNGKTEFHLGERPEFDDKPEDIFKLTDNELHISGRGYGYLTTTASYQNYHLVIEFRWEGKTWAPRAERARDNGILYHATGPHGIYGKYWPASYEANIIEGGMGDLLVLTPRDKDNKWQYQAQCEYIMDRNNQRRWKKGAPRRLVQRGRLNWKYRDESWSDTINFRGKRDLDAPLGGWNRLEVIARGNTAVHLFNGEVVAEAFDLNPAAGRVCIQTEAAAMIVRRFELLPLDTFEEPWSTE